MYRYIAFYCSTYVHVYFIFKTLILSFILYLFSYTHNSIELQLRQLADMAFLLQNYDLAMQSYQHLKKDFQGASAWLYYAGVVEMIGMSTYLMSSTRREVVSYLEEAISVYYSSCK